MIKILFFVDSFLPGYRGGGPIASISNLASLLNDRINILICTRNHDFGDTKVYTGIASDVVTKFEDKKVIYLSKLNILSVLKTIDDFNPDVIYLNSFFSKATQLVFFLNYIKYNKKIVIAPRGELQVNALKIKRIKKYTYLFLYKFLQMQKIAHFHSTDIIETESIKKLLNVNNITEISNVVKIHTFKPLNKKKHELKIIFVSRISKKKNLLFALECLKSIKHDVVFDIYGPKEDVGYWNECQNVINNLPANIKVKYKGGVDQKKVIPIMRRYHVFLLPTRSENFGHVIVEAMQAGLIPIISDQTPWVGLQDVNIGWSIPLNRKLDYIKAIDSLCKINSKDYMNKSSRTMSYIHTKIDINLIAEKYLNFFYKINT